GTTGPTNAAYPANAAGSSGTTNTAGATWTASSEFIGGISVAIRSIAPVLGIVLPITLSLAVHVPVYVFIVVPVKIIVVVDIDVATVPIAIAPMAAPGAPSSGTERDSCAPCQSRAWHVTRIG